MTVVVNKTPTLLGNFLLYSSDWLESLTTSFLLGFHFFESTLSSFSNDTPDPLVDSDFFIGPLVTLDPILYKVAIRITNYVQ